ncbi:MAG TPA: M4 family metallopeptidase [Thermoanaerobaculia bacterium]|nr:M4 family metallopeptidase [Thermoanaerobaculia bacterium]
MKSQHVRCSILPPYILRNIARNGDAEDRVAALAALALTAGRRFERQAPVAVVAGEIIVPSRARKRTVFDARQSQTLPGKRARGEGSAPSNDAAVNEAFDGAGRTYDFFREVLDRTSIDDRGMRIESTVHFGRAFANAHWNGRQMIYGDGDGKYFRRFTASLDVIAHELMHGVTQYAAGIGFSGQCGALAEHYSDVFGVLVKQYARKQMAARADWLVGAELLTSRVHGEAIRSMKAPGTAYDDRILGRDPQPSHMSHYVRTSSDDRGVHINSGIPNHAFYRVATFLGGRAWEVAGRIWYHALAHDLGPRSRFQHCADATWRAAGTLYGAGSEPQRAVRAGWSVVGIQISDVVRDERRHARPVFVPPDAAAEVPYLA